MTTKTKYAIAFQRKSQRISMFEAIYQRLKSKELYTSINGNGLIRYIPKSEY